jgi:hypothetical protein
VLGAKTTCHGSGACGAGGATPSGATRESECRQPAGGIDSEFSRTTGVIGFRTHFSAGTAGASRRARYRTVAQRKLVSPLELLHATVKQIQHSIVGGTYFRGRACCHLLDFRLNHERKVHASGIQCVKVQEPFFTDSPYLCRRSVRLRPRERSRLDRVGGPGAALRLSAWTPAAGA